MRHGVDAGPQLGQPGLARGAREQVAVGAGHDDDAGVGRAWRFGRRPRDATAHRQAQQVAPRRRTPQPRGQFERHQRRELVGEREPVGRAHGAVAVHAGVSAMRRHGVAADDVIERRLVGADDLLAGGVEVVRPSRRARRRRASRSSRFRGSDHEALRHGRSRDRQRHRALHLHHPFGRDDGGGRERRGGLRAGGRWSEAAGRKPGRQRDGHDQAGRGKRSRGHDQKVAMG